MNDFHGTVLHVLRMLGWHLTSVMSYCWICHMVLIDIYKFIEP